MNLQTALTLRAVISSRAQDTSKTGSEKFYSDEVTVRTSVRTCWVSDWLLGFDFRAQAIFFQKQGKHGSQYNSAIKLEFLRSNHSNVVNSFTKVCNDTVCTPK